MLVVQLVQIHWTKLSRGAPASNVRAALPRSATLEPVQAPYQFHVVALAEGNDFAPGYRKTEVQDQVPRRQGELVIAAEGTEGFMLGLDTRSFSGAPRRHPVPRALTVRSGGYVRLAINGRFANLSGQWYSEYTYNVYCGDTLRPDLFTCREPDRVFSLLDHLF